MVRRPNARARARDPRGEDGAVAVLVAGMLVVFLVLLAFTIDLSAGRQQQQQAQAAADAGALAGAQAIGETTTGPTVTAIASSVAAANDPGAAIDVTTSGDVVTVAVAAVNTNGFGNAVGARTTRVSGRAVAAPTYTRTTGVSQTIGTTITTGSTTTTGVTTTATTRTVTSPAATAIYAADSTCDGGLAISNTLLTTGLLGGLLNFPAGNVNINASTVISNGNLWVNSVNFPSNNSSFLYGGPSACSFYGPGLPSTSTRTATGMTYGFPVTYDQSSLRCTVNGGTTLSLGSGISSGVYCATGTITLALVGNVNLSKVTLIAPYIELDSPFGLGSISGWTPYASGYPLALATGSNGLYINFGLFNTQAQNLAGVIDAPNGPLKILAGTVSGTGLLEAQQVEVDTNNFGAFSGSGPAATATVSTTATVTTTGTTTTTGSSTTTGTTVTTGTSTGPAALTG
jgi:Flp pilus assembly protein TadG